MGGMYPPHPPPLATPLKTSPVERSLEDVLNVAAIFLDITPQSALPFIDAAHHKSHWKFFYSTWISIRHFHHTWMVSARILIMLETCANMQKPIKTKYIQAFMDFWAPTMNSWFENSLNPEKSINDYKIIFLEKDVPMDRLLYQKV